MLWKFLGYFFPAITVLDRYLYSSKLCQIPS